MTLIPEVIIKKTTTLKLKFIKNKTNKTHKDKNQMTQKKKHWQLISLIYN